MQNLINQHLKSANTGLNYLRQSYFASLITVLVIGIALALPMGLFIFLSHIQSLSGQIQKTYSLTLFLQNSVTADEIQELKHKLAMNPDIAEVEYVSKDSGLKELQQHSGLQDALRYLPENPLPPVLIVYPMASSHTAQALQSLSQELSRYPNVDVVQYDMQWLERLNSLLALGQRMVLILLVCFGCGVVLITGNTIRLTTQRLRQEIEVVYLLGGTKQFVRRPIVYSGVYYGAVGAMVAWVIVFLASYFLSSPINQVLKHYGTQLAIPQFSLMQIVFLLITGIILGYTGARVAVGRELRHLS